MTLAAILGLGDVVHGVVEGEAEDLDVEVNGIAGEVALRPAPVTVFDDEAGIGGQNKIARLPCAEFQSALLKQRHQRNDAGSADLLARPSGFRRVVGHSLCANEVG